MYPKALNTLINSFHKLPGAGTKTAERYAFSFLEMSEEEKIDFINALKNASRIQYCEKCGNLSDHELCAICSDKERNQNQICIVSSPRDIQPIESLNEYNGTYHVLNGLINLKKGVMPSDLNIQNLLKRINDDTEEVILALDPTVEGETTALYIQKLLGDKVNVTHLLQGIPAGSSLNYADQRTLNKAFTGRK